MHGVNPLTKALRSLMLSQIEGLMVFGQNGKEYGMNKEPSPKTKAEIEDLAREIRKEFNNKNSQELLDEIRKKENIATQYCSDDTKEESLVIDENEAIIYLPQNSSPARDRFTIAHELGHFFLHKNPGAPRVSFTRRGSDKFEWQANWFAAELLMPRDVFLETAAKYCNDEDALSRIFGVSKSAASVRLKSLNII